MAIISGFQPEDESSILSIRSAVDWFLVVHQQSLGYSGKSHEWYVINAQFSGRYVNEHHVKTYNLLPSSNG